MEELSLDKFIVELDTNKKRLVVVSANRFLFICDKEC